MRLLLHKLAGAVHIILATDSGLYRSLEKSACITSAVKLVALAHDDLDEGRDLIQLRKHRNRYMDALYDVMKTAHAAETTTRAPIPKSGQGWRCANSYPPRSREADLRVQCGDYDWSQYAR